VSAEDDHDARGFMEELTPVPLAELTPACTPAEAEARMARATCEQQRLELAANQATIDELRQELRTARAELRQANADRKVLADRLARLLTPQQNRKGRP
jgi:septal ring factor EnvC (AmiA/AmiB activator)